MVPKTVREGVVIAVVDLDDVFAAAVGCLAGQDVLVVVDICMDHH